MRWVVLWICCALPAQADVLAVSRVIRPGHVIGAGDVMRVRSPSGGLSDTAEVVGREARVTLYAGRPLRAADLAPPALVGRNQPVVLVYHREGLSMLVDGRALGRGAVGERIRVMNLQSRVAVSGVVLPDGRVAAGGGS